MSANTFNARKGINIGPVTADPSSPTNGTIIYRSDLNKFRKYENGAWSDLDTTGGSSALNSTVSVNTPNGYGTGSVVRRWSVLQVSSGSDITYADHSTLDGGTFTINTTGTYSMSCTDRSVSSQSSRYGFTVNDSNVNHGVGIDSMTYAQGYRAMTQCGGPNAFGSLSLTIPLTAGDVVRVQGGTTVQADSTEALCQFTITRVN